MQPYFHWINEPAEWRRDADGLTVVTNKHTDFWRIPGMASSASLAISMPQKWRAILPCRQKSVRISPRFTTRPG